MRWGRVTSVTILSSCPAPYWSVAARKAVVSVYTARVLERLLDIQRRAGKDDGSLVRALALDAQEDLLEIERQIVAALAQVHELNRRLEKCHEARHADLYHNEDVIR